MGLTHWYLQTDCEIVAVANSYPAHLYRRAWARLTCLRNLRRLLKTHLSVLLRAWRVQCQPTIADGFKRRRVYSPVKQVNPRSITLWVLQNRRLRIEHEYIVSQLATGAYRWWHGPFVDNQRSIGSHKNVSQVTQVISRNINGFVTSLGQLYQIRFSALLTHRYQRPYQVRYMIRRCNYYYNFS